MAKSNRRSEKEIPKTVIRLIKPEECFVVGRMWKDLLEETKAFPIQITEKIIETFSVQLLTKALGPNRDVFILESDYRPIGFVMVELQVYPYTSLLTGYCENIYVHPKFRAFLLGKKLIDRAYQWMKERGVNFISFDTVYDPKLIKRWNLLGYKTKKLSFQKEIHYG